MTKKILITGAFGQIGTELTLALKKIYGDNNVISSDLKKDHVSSEFSPYEILDVLDKNQLNAELQAFYNPQYHASYLEQSPKYHPLPFFRIRLPSYIY